MQAQTPSASPRARPAARSPPLRAARSHRPPGARGRRHSRTGTPRGWRERRGGGKAGAARPASPVWKSSGSLLLANANTALFFPDRANAPGTGAATRGAPAKRSASSGKARRSQSRHPGRFSRRPATRGAPRGPQGERRAAEAANAPATTCGPLARRTSSREIPDPHSQQRPSWRGPAEGTRSPFCSGGDERPPPSRELSLSGFQPSRPAAQRRGPRGCVRLEGNTRGVQLWGGGPAERGQASGGEDTTVGMSWEPARKKLRGMENRSGGRAETEGTKAKPGDTGGPASSRDKSEFRRVRKVRGASEGFPSPTREPLAPKPTPLSTPRYARRKRCGCSHP